MMIFRRWFDNLRRALAQHVTNARRFDEANHLADSIDVPHVVQLFLDEQDHRRMEGYADWRLPFCPDRGRTTMDDLLKPMDIAPGYSLIGRLRGLLLGLWNAECFTKGSY